MDVHCIGEIRDRILTACRDGFDVMPGASYLCPASKQWQAACKKQRVSEGPIRSVIISTIWLLFAVCSQSVRCVESVSSRHMTEKGKSLARLRPLSRLGQFGVRAGRAEDNLALSNRWPRVCGCSRWGLSCFAQFSCDSLGFTVWTGGAPDG